MRKLILTELFLFLVLFNLLAVDDLAEDLGNNEFLIAVGENDIAQVSKILNWGYEDIEYKNDLGLTAIRIAVENEYNKMIDLLLDIGANFDDTSKFIQAMYDNNLKIAEKMLKNGINPNFKIYRDSYNSYLFGKEHDYPLLYSIRNKNLNFVNLLLNNDVDVNVSNYETALMISVKQNVDIKIIGKLIDRGINIDANLIYSDGSTSGTALIEAIKHENLKLAEFLLDHGANTEMELFNNGTYDSYTPLMLAVRKNNFKATQLLINHNADVNYRNCQGTSILESAEDIKIQNILKEHGAK